MKKTVATAVRGCGESRHGLFSFPCNFLGSSCSVCHPHALPLPPHPPPHGIPGPSYFAGICDLSVLIACPAPLPLPGDASSPGQRPGLCVHTIPSLPVPPPTPMHVMETGPSSKTRLQSPLPQAIFPGFPPLPLAKQTCSTLQSFRS